MMLGSFLLHQPHRLRMSTLLSGIFTGHHMPRERIKPSEIKLLQLQAETKDVGRGGDQLPWMTYRVPVSCSCQWVIHICTSTWPMQIITLKIYCILYTLMPRTIRVNGCIRRPAWRHRQSLSSPMCRSLDILDQSFQIITLSILLGIFLRPFIRCVIIVCIPPVPSALASFLE